MIRQVHERIPGGGGSIGIAECDPGVPATPCDAASIAFRRIVDFIGQTEFGVATSEDPVNLRLKMGYVGYEKGDTAERLIGRARAAVA